MINRRDLLRLAGAVLAASATGGAKALCLGEASRLEAVFAAGQRHQVTILMEALGLRLFLDETEVGFVQRPMDLEGDLYRHLTYAIRFEDDAVMDVEKLQVLSDVTDDLGVIEGCVIEDVHLRRFLPGEKSGDIGKHANTACMWPFRYEAVDRVAELDGEYFTAYSRMERADESGKDPYHVRARVFNPEDPDQWPEGHRPEDIDEIVTGLSRVANGELLIEGNAFMGNRTEGACRGL